MKFLLVLLFSLNAIGFVASNERTESIDNLDALDSNYVTIKTALELDLEAIFTHISTPSNPSSGFTKFYSKSDNKLYSLTSAGVESQVGSGFSPNFTTVTKTTTATLATTGEDNVAADTSGGSFTLTLPTAVGNNGLTYKISKYSSSNVLTVDADGTETIGTVLSISLYSLNDALILSSDGSNWILTSITQKDRCETKYLTSNITTDTTGVTSLAFSSLITGARYRVFFNMRAGFAVVDNILGDIISNSIDVCKNNIAGSGNTEIPGNMIVCDFVAGATTLSVDITSIAATNTVYGGSDTNTTFIRLCTDLNSKETTEF